MLEDIEIIRKKLKENGYTNKSIDYKEFLELYEPYRKEMKEKEFAEILGISYCNHDNMKYKGRRIKILKEENNISEERKEEIRENLRKNGYTNKLINYQEFIELYEPYRTGMKEKEFAKILGISYGNHNNMKNKGQRARILKEKNKISKERKEKIRETLRKNGNANKLINYQEFIELYEPYRKEMKETEFAEIIGILYYNYKDIKYTGTRARILKEQNKIAEERKEEIRENLRKNGYANKLINYQEFIELYEPYRKEMKETEFAEILGISYGNYNTMRNVGQRATIRFNYKELNRIKYQLKLESREYKKEELEKLCEKYKVTLYDLLLYLFPNVDTEKLINKEVIYIGICPMPKEFLEKYSEKLLQTAQILSKKISSKYKLGRYREDIASDILLYLIEKKGDLVKNSETEEEALEIIRRYMATAIKYQYIKKCQLRGSALSLDENITQDKKKIRYDVVKAPKVEMDLAEKTEQSEGNIVKDMRRCYEEGMQNTEAIMYIKKKYEISKEELLKILEEELIKKRKIMKTSTGKVYLGEEIE